jgi:hypothetical protein
MPTRPSSGSIRESSRTRAQDEEDAKILDELVKLVPLEPLTTRIRAEMSNPGIAEDLREMAANMLEDAGFQATVPPEIDVKQWAKDLEEHADDPPSEEDVNEEVVNASFFLLTHWVNAMITVALQGGEAAKLTVALAPVSTQDFWEYARIQVPLDEDAEHDPIVTGLIENIMKRLPLRLPRETVVLRGTDGQLKAQALVYN